MLKGFLLDRIVRGLLACTLAAGALWWVAEHSGPPEGTVVLHVLEPGIDVTLAGRVYHFRETTAEPLVVRLPAGRYPFRVRRRGTVLHAEDFTLRGGESLVLAAIRDERGVPDPLARPAGATRTAAGKRQEVVGRRP
jgi:hypothetical protein